MVALMAVAIGLARLQNAQRSANSVDPLGRVALALTAPISERLGNALDGNSQFWGSLFRSGSLKAENERLRAFEQQWALYSEQVASLEQQLDDLRRTASLPALGNRKRVAADVIGYDPVTSRITLSVGSSQGVQPGQAVVTGQGLVGQIQTVEPNRSQALLVISPVLRLGAMIGGSPPVTGLIRGQGTRRLLFEIVESNRVFQQGERVVTSLHSERTPPNLPIGFVLKQESAQEYGITRLIVIPAVDIARVREVFVIQ